MKRKKLPSEQLRSGSKDPELYIVYSIYILLFLFYFYIFNQSWINPLMSTDFLTPSTP